MSYFYKKISRHYKDAIHKITDSLSEADGIDKLIVIPPPPAFFGAPRQSEFIPKFVPLLNLLVIPLSTDLRPTHEIVEAVEVKSSSIIPVNVVVHDFHYFNQQLLCGNPFFCHIRDWGIRLLDRTGQFFIHGPAPDYANFFLQAQNDLERWLKQGAGFSIAAWNTLNYPRVASFCLHQAAECSYSAIHTVFTGYKPATHNIVKWHKAALLFLPTLATIFPDDPDDQHYLYLLQKAYVEARYKEYTISDEELKELFKRVDRLITTASLGCTGWLEG